MFKLFIAFLLGVMFGPRITKKLDETAGKVLASDAATDFSERSSERIAAYLEDILFGGTDDERRARNLSNARANYRQN